MLDPIKLDFRLPSSDHSHNDFIRTPYTPYIRYPSNMIPSAGRIFFSSLLLSSFVRASQSNNTALEIEAIRAHFQGAGLVPSLLASFIPTALLTAAYVGVGAVTPGQLLLKAQTQTAPHLMITPANVTTLLNEKYTVVMVDAWAPGNNETRGQICHWLVNGVTIQDHSVSMRGSLGVEQYRGPAPPSGSGPHRYVILLYAQQLSTVPPPAFPQGSDPVFFHLADYVKASKIGPLIAGTYFTVQEGIASFIPSPTSPVVTSALMAWGSSPSTSASTDVHHNGAISSSSNYLTILLAPFLWLVAL
ncbi:phosphatidylethanolamine-binding protein [Suillus paluster]|uniref:phosphatidylethanolamine-binding protein n=1 Tax=Suillus paluster TaxID=48578 RepID=UPI001B884FBE|nr:phosphatidylethanolamine-binding protein [Suillus paluster]KAG1756232.1 phosphatidylethanolamine-binding protein [Suillus paluster]